MWGFRADEIRASLTLVTVTIRNITGTFSLWDSQCFRLPGCLLLMLEELELGAAPKEPTSLSPSGGRGVFWLPDCFLLPVGPVFPHRSLS